MYLVMCAAYSTCSVFIATTILLGIHPKSPQLLPLALLFAWLSSAGYCLQIRGLLKRGEGQIPPRN